MTIKKHNKALNFTEKRKRCVFIKKILEDSNNYIGQDNYPNIFNFLVDIFKTYHRDWNDKCKGHPIDRFIVQQASGQHTYCYYLVIGDTKVDIGMKGLRKNSYKDSVRKEDIKAACRSAIKPVIDKFKNQFNYPFECPIMEGEKFGRNDVDVHHFDKDFDTVVLSWINEKNNIDNICKKINDKSDENCDTHFIDEKLINDFIEYHNCNSKLLLLSKKGHKKGHRNNIENDELYRLYKIQNESIKTSL